MSKRKIKSVFPKVDQVHLYYNFIYIHFFCLYTYGASLITLHSFTSQRVLFTARTKISYAEIIRGTINNSRIFDKDEFFLVYVAVCRDTEAKFSSGNETACFSSHRGLNTNSITRGTRRQFQFTFEISSLQNFPISCG